MPLPSRVSFVIQVVERTTVPQTAMYAEIIAVTIKSDGIRAVSLQFDRVGPGFLGCPYDLKSCFQVTAMVSRHFSNHVWRECRANLPSIYSQEGLQGSPLPRLA